MRVTLLTFLLSIFYLNNYAQSDTKIELGKIDQIHSKILDEERKIWVYVPDENNDGIEFAKTKYPVVYLLDGDAHFYSVVGMIRQLSSVNGNTVCPKMIVVGIPNTNRTRDLTPTKGTPHPFIDSTMIANSGGGEAFMEFMEKELIPHIETNYPTKPYRMLIGHSFGGLTAMNALVNHTELFNSYVSIDPSMWWSDQQLLKEIKKLGNRKKYKNKSLFLGIANTMSEGMDTLQVQKDTTKVTEHIRALIDLGKHLTTHSNGLNFKQKYYPNDDHGSVPLITEYDALRHIFKNYELKMGPQDFMNPSADLIDRVKNHYTQLTEQFGYEIKPAEQLVNQMGYQFLQMEQMELAVKLFNMNVLNYPKSPNVYDSLGDFYVTTKNKAKAIDSFKKALALKEMDYTRDKLNELENKK